MKKKILMISLTILTFLVSTLFLTRHVLASELDDETEDTQNQYEEHKVLVKITKVDENQEPLSGATLQIIDAFDYVVEEWESDGSVHEIMLPEGEYVLHETVAPIGYEIAPDQTFTVEAVLNEINAGTDHDSEVCEHYGGIPLYYVEVEVESQGTKQKQEVYCINQGWEEPDGINYDGEVVTIDNITEFVPDYDKSMTNKELYDKVLDIIYHRSKASEVFPDLSNVEIRYITEVALKNYTSADYESPNGKDSAGNYIMTKIFREYTYDANVNSKYRVTPGEGDAFGNLAKHWWVYHKEKGTGKKIPIPSKYADLYYYLVRNEDHHPSDMHLYVYSTNTQLPDGDSYQNLLGVVWFNPYDDNHVVEVIMEDKYSTEVTDVTIEKIWEDDNNRDDIRPESLDVTLSNGTTVTLSEENGWKATIENLPVYDKGTKINYTWSEVSAYGYKLISNVVNGYVTTLTNYHKPSETTIIIKKIWDDYDDVSQIRPNEIIVDLLIDNEVVDTLTITSEDGWEGAFTNLKEFDGGVKIEYVVREREIPEYETSYSVDGNTYTITNHHELGKGNGPEEEPPQTGIIYNKRGVFIVLMNMFGLSFAVRRTKED